MKKLQSVAVRHVSCLHFAVNCLLGLCQYNPLRYERLSGYKSGLSSVPEINSDKFIRIALGFCDVWPVATYTVALREWKLNKFISIPLSFCDIWLRHIYCSRLGITNKFVLLSASAYICAHE